MKTATVKFYNPNKGYGFLTVKGQKDVFFHRKAFVMPLLYENGNTRYYPTTLERVPEKGDKIVFGEISKEKGPAANPWTFADLLTETQQILEKMLSNGGQHEYVISVPVNGKVRPGPGLWTGYDLREAGAKRAIRQKGTLLRKTKKEGFKKVPVKKELALFTN